MLLKLRSNCNGIVQNFNFIHHFRHLLLYSTSSNSSRSNPNFTNYLVEYLGFSNQQALSTSTKFVHNRTLRGATKVSDFDFIENANSVITFFKQIGLEQSQIRTAIVSDPQILLCNVDKTLIPKTLVFKEFGFSESDFSQVVNVNPTIFLMSLDSSIIPAIKALTEIMGDVNHVIAILKKTCGLRLSCVPKLMVPNVGLLRNYGVSIESIRRHILRNTAPFLRNTEVFEAAVIKVKEELGIPLQSPQFMSGVVLFSSAKEDTIELKRSMFKSFGWTDSDVLRLSMTNPYLLMLSEASIKKKLGFFMNELGYDSSFLSKRCFMISCSLEKRIIPRHKVFQLLKEKGLVGMDYSFVTALSLTEPQFLKRFVLPFKEVHDIYYQNSSVRLEMPTAGPSKPNSNAA